MESLSAITEYLNNGHCNLFSSIVGSEVLSASPRVSSAHGL